jgi:adenylate cyclase
MTTRRLAAILAADVVGFSTMMEKDEEGTASHVRAVRREVIEPKLSAHQGRLVKTTGDGFLAEFASPVEAVRCALSIQDGIAERGEANEGLKLRIDINLGDIIIEDDGDVFGDGVNVAARLEQMADPGGVLISGKIYEEIEGKIHRRFETRGEQQVKNLARPVKVYALAGATPSKALPKPLPLPDKPSIAVLPFTNMSGDPEVEYFVDGVVEEIITALSGVKWFFVIARNSSFTYKGRAVDVKQVGLELGVRYILEGSVRKSGARVRIIGQLVEAAAGHQLWADRFEGTLENVFQLQDQIAASVVAALEPSLRSAEINRARKKPTESLGAYDLYLRAIFEFRTYGEPGYRAAENLLRKAVAHDPEFADAWALLTDCLGRMTFIGWYPDLNRGKSETAAAASRAALTGPDNPFALSAAAWGLGIFAGQTETAIALAEKSLRLHPNSADIHTNVGFVFLYAGQIERAIEHFVAAHRLNPLDPRAHFHHTGMAMAHFFASRFDAAIDDSQKVIFDEPKIVGVRRYLIAALAHLGRVDEARAEARKLLELAPNMTITRASNFGFQRRMRELLEAGLRLAGLPE